VVRPRARPGGLPVLVGLSGVAVAIGTTGALRQVIGSPDGDTLDDDGASTGSGATADGDAADDEEEGAPGERGDGDRDGGDDASGERS
jgi:hypothetical protein